MDSTHRDLQQQQVLEVSDRVARAAYLWISHGNGIAIPAIGSAGREDLIAGILCGLCRALDLDKRHALMSAYIYSLIDGDVSDALANAHSMFDGQRCEAANPAAYQSGLRAAGDLVALIESPHADSVAHARPI